jgi:hypothetical protein
MRKIIGILVVVIGLSISCYFAFYYYATYSDGNRSGELIKLSHKGMVFKTWEGEISQGIAGAQIFKFSVLDSDKKVIEDLQKLEGKYVKVHYIERYKTFSWWGDTKYFITDVQPDVSPFKIK